MNEIDLKAYVPYVYEKSKIDVKIAKLIKATCDECNGFSKFNIHYAIRKLVDTYNDNCDIPIVLV